MPGTSPSVGAKLARMQIVFALAAVPATFGTAVVCVLGINHFISYWWLALCLGWAVIPLSVFLHVQRYLRRVRSGRPPGDRAAGLAPWRA